MVILRTGTVGDVHASGRLDPNAVVGDAAVGLDGADDRVGGELDFIGAFEDVFEHEAKVAFAQGDKAQGVGVTVDARTVGDFVILGDLLGHVPAEEFILDFGAVGVAANAAIALVMREANCRGRM